MPNKEENHLALRRLELQLLDVPEKVAIFMYGRRSIVFFSSLAENVSSFFLSLASRIFTNLFSFSNARS
jgi:hypothetical protein